MEALLRECPEELESEAFDPAKYVGRTTPSEARGSLKRLAALAEDAVASFLETTLGRSSGALDVSKSREELASTRRELVEIRDALLRAHRVVASDVSQLERDVEELRNCAVEALALRRLKRFRLGVSKLEDLKTNASLKEIVKAAAIVKEVESLSIELKGVSEVDESSRVILDKGQSIRLTTYKLGSKAFDDLDQGALASCLQAAFNLNELSELTAKLMERAAKKLEKAFEVRVDPRTSFSKKDATFSGLHFNLVAPPHGLESEYALDYLAELEGFFELRGELRLWGVRAWNLCRVAVKKTDSNSYKNFGTMLGVEEVVNDDVVVKTEYKNALFDDFWMDATSRMRKVSERFSSNQFVMASCSQNYPRLRFVSNRGLSVLARSTQRKSAPAAGRSESTKESLRSVLEPFGETYGKRVAFRVSSKVEEMFSREGNPPNRDDVADLSYIVSKELEVVKFGSENDSLEVEISARIVSGLSELVSFAKRAVRRDVAAYKFSLKKGYDFKGAESFNARSRTSAQSQNVALLQLVAEAKDSLGFLSAELESELNDLIKLIVDEYLRTAQTLLVDALYKTAREGYDLSSGKRKLSLAVSEFVEASCVLHKEHIRHFPSTTAVEVAVASVASECAAAFLRTASCARPVSAMDRLLRDLDAVCQALKEDMNVDFEREFEAFKKLVACGVCDVDEYASYAKQMSSLSYAVPFCVLFADAPRELRSPHKQAKCASVSEFWSLVDSSQDDGWSLIEDSLKEYRKRALKRDDLCPQYYLCYALKTKIG